MPKRFAMPPAQAGPKEPYGGKKLQTISRPNILSHHPEGGCQNVILQIIAIVTSWPLSQGWSHEKRVRYE